jgi:hypothetical protein
MRRGSDIGLEPYPPPPYVLMVLLQNVPRQIVPLQNDPIQKVTALKRPSYKTSRPQNVPSYKTSQAPKRPNPKTSQPQNVPASKRPKPQNVPAPEQSNSKTYYYLISRLTFTAVSTHIFAAPVTLIDVNQTHYICKSRASIVVE